MHRVMVEHCGERFRVDQRLSNPLQVQLIGCALMTDTGISDHARTQRAVSSATPPRILVVEDDALVALGIRLTLLELGYEVVGIAASESEALALAGSERPDLALMDIRLRGPVDGVDTARRLRADHGIRSVYLSAYADEQTMARVTQTYPLGFVQKPYAASQLRAALDLAFRRLAQNTETSG
jgi:CheY-like chemotaxis protein